MTMMIPLLAAALLTPQMKNAKRKDTHDLGFMMYCSKRYFNNLTKGN